MNNSSDFLKHIIKYPLILPKPASSGPDTTAVTTENVQQDGPSRVVSKRNTCNEDMGPPTKQKSMRPDQVESQSLPSETVSLLKLIETYYHLESDRDHLLHFTTACQGSSRNHKRHKAVRKSLQACYIHKDARTVPLKIWEKFFKMLEQYHCFSENEIIAVKDTMNLLDGNKHLEGKFSLISQDQPPLDTLIQRYKNEKLRYVPPEYPVYSASYKRAAAVLETVEKCDIFGNLNNDTIERFFAILTCFCLFDRTEIAAVKKHLYSVLCSHLQGYSKKVIYPENEGSLVNETIESLETEPTESSLITEPIKTSLVAEPNETSSETELFEASSVMEPVETSCPNLVSLCPICREDVGKDDVWHHILKTHVEWEKAVMHGMPLNDTKFCTHCFQTGFSTLKDVMKHETRVHGTNTENSCTFCGATCHDIFGFYRHVVEQHGILYSCPKCREEFCLKNDFIQHLKKLHSVKCSAAWWRHQARYFCPFCNARFTCHGNIVNHLFNKYNASKSDSDISKQLFCFSCGTSFQTHKAFSYHLQFSDFCNCKELKIKADHRSFVCYSCKERFETQAALDFHQSLTANFVLTAPVSNAGPRNFKKKVFSVTCDLKRLRRAELDRHPQALDSMLNSFETLHKPDQKGYHSSEVRTLNKEDTYAVNSFKVGIKQDRENPAVETDDMIVPISENKEQKQAVSIKPKRRKGTKRNAGDRHFDKNKVVPVVIDNADQQPKIQPVTINDRQGNTVIINNQSGGSNTIILGSCCSHDANQQANPSNSTTPSLSVNEHYPRSARGSANENISEVIIKDEEDNVISETTPVDKKRIFNETVFDIQSMVREQFKSLETGRKEEINNTKSALQHQEKNEKRIRDIVRQEFEKYLESMYRGTKPPHEEKQESNMIADDTLSKLVPAIETQILNDVQKENRGSSADTNKIDISQRTTVHVPHKHSQLESIQPNSHPEIWRAEEPVSFSSCNYSDYQQGNMKPDVSSQRSGLFMSDKDSMQALYGIKSPEKQCLTKTEPCMQQSKVRLGIKRDKPNDYSEMVNTSSDPGMGSKIHQVSGGITDMSERNNILSTDIKVEPMSPPPVYEDIDEAAETRNIKKKKDHKDNDEETAKKRNDSDFYQIISSVSCNSSTTTVAVTIYSESSDVQNHNKNTTESHATTVKLHNKHITELESVIASIKEEVDVEGSKDNRRNETADENSQKAQTNTGTSQSVITTQSILSTQLQMMPATSCKTVAVLMPTKDRGYIAGVLEPSLGVTKALKCPEVFGCSSKADKQTGKGISSPSDVNQTCIPQSFNTSMMPNSSSNVMQNSLLLKRFTSLSELAGQNIVIQPSNIQTFGQNAAKSDEKISSTDKTATDLSTAIDVATVEPLLSGASRKKEDGSVSLAKASSAIRPLTQASLSQSFCMMPAPPFLQGPNIPAPSSSYPNISKASANQTLPQLSLLLPSSHILPASQFYSSMPLLGNKTIPSQNVPAVMGTQTIPSLNIPVMSVSQAFSNLNTQTVNLPLPSQSSRNEKTNHSEKLDSAGPNTNKGEGNEAVGEEKMTVNIIGSDIIVKKEREDSTNDLTKDSQAAEQLHTEADSLSTAKEAQQTNPKVLNVSTSQSVPTNQILMDQNIAVQGSNQTLPAQALQLLPGNQMFPGQSVQMLSPNQGFQCQTIPMWPGQIMPQQSILNFSAIQAQALQGLAVSTPANITAVSAQTTTTTTTAASAEVTTSSKTEKADVQSIPLKFVGADQKGMLFQSQEVNTQCLFIPGQTNEIVPKGCNSVAPPGKVPIAPLKKVKIPKVLLKSGERVKDVLQKSRNGLLKEQTHTEMFKDFVAKSLVRKKVVENMLLKAKRAKVSSSKTSDAASECMHSEEKIPHNSNPQVEKKTHGVKSQSVYQTGYMPLNQTNIGYRDSMGQNLSELENQDVFELAELKNQTNYIKIEAVGEEDQSSILKTQTGSENNQISIKEKQPASEPENQNHSGSTKPKIIPYKPRKRCTKKKKDVSVGNSAAQGVGVMPETIATGQQQAKKIQPSPQINLQTAGLQQNMLTFVPNNVQFGNNMLQNTVVLNQGVPMAVQQNPVIQTGIQQNTMAPVQNMVFQNGQIIPQQMVYQPFQVQQGSVVLPQYIMTGSGSQSNPVMMVQQPQVMTLNTGNQPQVILSGTQLNSVGQLPVTSQPAGLQQSQVTMSGAQSNQVEPQPSKNSQHAGIQQPQLMLCSIQSGPVTTMGQQPSISKQAGLQQPQLMLSGTQSNPVPKVVQQPTTSKQAGLQQSQLMLSGTQSNQVPTVVQQPTTSKQAVIQQPQLMLSGTHSYPVPTVVQQTTTSKQAGQQQPQLMLSGTQSNLVPTVVQQPTISKQAGIQQPQLVLSATKSYPVPTVVQQPTTSKQAWIQQTSNLRPIKAKKPVTPLPDWSLVSPSDASGKTKPVMLENAKIQYMGKLLPDGSLLPASNASQENNASGLLKNAVIQDVSLVVAPSASKIPKVFALMEKSMKEAKLQAKLLPDGSLVPCSDAYKNVEFVLNIGNVKRLGDGLDLRLSPETMKDTLNHFKTYIEHGQLPSKTDIDNYSKNCVFDVPDFTENNIPFTEYHRRARIQALLKACICQTVDLSQSFHGNKIPFGWLEEEDKEIRNCFQRHFLHGDAASLVESEIALMLAQLLNWTFQRRTVPAICARVRYLQARSRKSHLKEKRVGRRKRRRSRQQTIVDDDDDSDSEYDYIDKKLNIEPSISSVRENLRRKVKERASMFIETSDSDDFDDQFEFETLTDEHERGEEAVGDGNEMVQVESDSSVTINVDVDSGREVNETIHEAPNLKGSTNIPEDDNGIGESNMQEIHKDAISLLEEIGKNDTYGHDKDAVSSFEEWESCDTSDYEIEEYENKTNKSRTKTMESAASNSKPHAFVTLEKVQENIIKKHVGLDKRKDGDGNEKQVSFAEKQHATLEEESDTNDYDIDKLVIKIEDSDED